VCSTSKANSRVGLFASTHECVRRFEVLSFLAPGPALDEVILVLKLHDELVLMTDR
jgi:hypothetical protein